MGFNPNNYYTPFPQPWELTPSQSWSFYGPQTISGPSIYEPYKPNPYLQSAQMAMMAASPIAGQIAGQDNRPILLGSAPNAPSAGAYGSQMNPQLPKPYRNKSDIYRSLLARYLMGVR